MLTYNTNNPVVPETGATGLLSCQCRMPENLASDIGIILSMSSWHWQKKQTLL